MQRWTNIKPNRAGYWWTMDKDGACYIGHVCWIPRGDLIECDLHFDIGDDYFKLDSPYFNGYKWGTSPIPEPVGEKL